MFNIFLQVVVWDWNWPVDGLLDKLINLREGLVLGDVNGLQLEVWLLPPHQRMGQVQHGQTVLAAIIAEADLIQAVGNMQ